MQLIPVLDLKGGQVVRAVQGERQAYRPWNSDLARSADPLHVVARMLEIAPFRTLYVADLDAITGSGQHDTEIRALRARFPALTLWVDSGETGPAALAARLSAGLGVPVVGTESLSGLDAARAALAAPGVILSLDRDARGLRGPKALHAMPELWPEEVIVMTLARVGSGEGPDMEALDAATALRRSGRFYAAGGVRDAADLDALARRGIAGALVASALHDGRIGPEAARRYA
ncbi:HisA/HisF-related TIM barrel protein [Xanthobacter tagetidis]|uniref:Nickel transporter n=1 Tax=Xanthobacter tagetidis TaxID=60216 RepID=A0A3L7AM71_9HYPH|nr:HisA/HisF-related TIM barrel protein [Xanthobacter tagetidis]RLP80522.1 nickel transporter [Xanthobacter tagetidis]